MTHRPGGRQSIPRPSTWRDAGPPPWTGRDLSILGDTPALVERLRSRLATVDGHGPDDRRGRPSAVLVGFLTAASSPTVLLTRRSDHLRNHAGEISFPGGRVETGESPEQAALREAREEIGLDPSFVSPIGSMQRLTTVVSDSLITPVVAEVHGEHEWVVDGAEVARVLAVPLAELVRADTHRAEAWSTPRGDHDVHFFMLDDETIWGATARMLVHLIDTATA